MNHVGLEDAVILEKGTKVITPYGEGQILSYTDSCPNHGNVAIELKKWTMADGKSPIAYFGYSYSGGDEKSTDAEKKMCITKYLRKKHDIITLDTIHYQRYIQERQRHFALDLTPSLLYANGAAVSGMIDSGVAEYCEFKSVIGLELLMKQDEPRRRGVRGGANGQNGDDVVIPTLSRVPCSKRDVFQTKLLSPVDKRRLMKFLQISSDYAVAKSIENSANLASGSAKKSGNNEDEIVSTTENESSTVGDVEEEVVTSLNERQLQQGRSLYRPQNKSVATSDLEVLKQCINDGIPFEAYLTEHHKLSENMRNIIIHAMALGSCNAKSDDGPETSSNYTTQDGMNDLCRHLQSLGKFGGTAFLVPLYGSGELSQAFCRSAAVHGGTYLLRRGAQNITLNENREVSGVVLNGCTYEDGEVLPSKHISGAHVIIPSKMLKKTKTLHDSNKTKVRVYRRISIIRGKLLSKSKVGDAGDSDEQRHIIIIPPGDESIKNSNVIHGVALDESVSISPSSKDGFETTVLHLTTTSKSNNEDFRYAHGETVLRHATQSLLTCHEVATHANHDLKELFHLSFSYELEEEIDSSVTKNTNGIHICRDRGMSLTVESAFVEAKRLFNKICPNTNSFLKLSDKMDELVKERSAGQEEDDDEVKLLSSALDMMKTGE